jgi:hypothetical protein
MKDIIVKPSLFSFSIDLPQRRLDPFNQVLLSELSIRIAEALQASPSTESFRLRIGDALFSYDLFCTFFGDNVDVRKTAERLTLTFKNGMAKGNLTDSGIPTKPWAVSVGHLGDPLLFQLVAGFD